MISPPGLEGVAFTQSSEGDVGGDLQARLAVIQTTGMPTRWATVTQVHGNEVLRADTAGEIGSGDALWTTEEDLAVAVFTADCFGVVLVAPEAVGVAHAGWRGARSGVVNRLRTAMTGAGHSPVAAAVGPGIGPCCFEVGQEVLKEFPGNESTTTWGTDSVDLRSVVDHQLEGLHTWFSSDCTLHDEGFFSHRGDSTEMRMATLGWVT